jgi:hypothetical protein
MKKEGDICLIQMGMKKPGRQKWWQDRQIGDKGRRGLKMKIWKKDLSQNTKCMPCTKKTWPKGEINWDFTQAYKLLLWSHLGVGL